MGSDYHVQLLLTAGAAVDATALDGQTPLHIAAQCSQLLRVLECLLAAGANPRFTDRNGKSPLDLAKAEHRGCLQKATRGSSPS